jgi:hypothetical protein
MTRPAADRARGFTFAAVWAAVLTPGAALWASAVAWATHADGARIATVALQVACCGFGLALVLAAVGYEKGEGRG